MNTNLNQVATIVSKQFNPPRSHIVTGFDLPLRQILYLPHRRLYDGVVEVSTNYKTNYDMTLLVALAFVAICCQGMVKVEKPRGGASPVSLMILILADSGTRKSALVKALFKVVKGVQRDLLDEFEDANRNYTRKHEAWKEIGKALKAKLRKGVIQGNDINDIEIELEAHLANEPDKPLKPKFLYEDTTGPGLWKSMLDSVRSVAVVSSEASAGFDKWLQQDLCNFNNANDGEPIDIARAGDGTYEIQATLTFLLMLQPGVFDDFLRKSKSDLRSLGLWARFLVCRPESLAGIRFDNGAEQSSRFLEAIHERGRELLYYSYKVMCGKAKKLEVCFDGDAKQLWLEIYNEIESQQRPGNYFEGMKDHASKMMDIISRVAACIHLFEDYEGDISVDTLISAREICFHSADYFLSQFVHPPEVVSDAIAINNYLNRHYRAFGHRIARKSEVRNGIGIKGLRKAARFDPALFQLKSEGVVKEIYQKNYGRKGTSFIDLSPLLPPYNGMIEGYWEYV